ncbi:MAG: hypothetical protein ACT7A5_13840 [Ferrovibrionaceae bacterium]
MSDQQDQAPMVEPIEASAEEFAAFGWQPEGDAFVRDGLQASRDDDAWQVAAAGCGALLGRFPTVSTVRRFAKRIGVITDWSAPSPDASALEAARMMALAVIEEEVATARDTVAALEDAIADAEERVEDMQAKALLFTLADDDDEDEEAPARA